MEKNQVNDEVKNKEPIPKSIWCPGLLYGQNIVSSFIRQGGTPVGAWCDISILEYIKFKEDEHTKILNTFKDSIESKNAEILSLSNHLNYREKKCNEFEKLLEKSKNKNKGFWSGIFRRWF